MKNRYSALVTTGLSVLLVLITLIIAACGGSSSSTTTPNNTSSLTTTSSSQLKLPDLIIKNSWMEETDSPVAVGTVVKFHLVIENIGDEKILASYYVLLGNNNGFSGGLQPGESKEVVVNWTAEENGTQTVVWTVDYGKRITESNEDNNDSKTYAIVVQ